jgi:hypothetical protein
VKKICAFLGILMSSLASFAQPVFGFEGALGERVTLTAPFGSSWQWRQDGKNLEGATNRLLEFNLSRETVGAYEVVTSVDGGELITNRARVDVRSFTENKRDFRLVADSLMLTPDKYYLPLAPQWAGIRNGEATILNGIYGWGMFRWKEGLETIFTLPNPIPGLPAGNWFISDATAEENGTVCFLVKWYGPKFLAAMIEGSSAGFRILAKIDDDVAGFSGVRISTLAPPIRRGGKTAFLVTGTSNYFGVAVFAGTTVHTWIDSRTPLPINGDSWSGVSPWIGFDGATAAFQVFDQHQHSMIMATDAAGTFRTIAAPGLVVEGNQLPMSSFGPTVTVADGRVLFFASNRENSFLIQTARGGGQPMRVIARCGDTIVERGSIGLFADSDFLRYSVCPLADGSIVFNAYAANFWSGEIYGPALTICRWRDGVISEDWSVFQRFAGASSRDARLTDFDGNDYIFESDGRYLTTLPRGWTPANPVMHTRATTNGFRVAWEGSVGRLQESIDLVNWNMVQEGGGAVTNHFESGRFFRVFVP